MKKRHILFLVTALVMIATTILPALTCRISYEHKHRGFVPAIELNDTAAQFSKADFVKVLRDYRASGITTALLREGEDGSFNASLLAMAKEAGLDTAISVYGGNLKNLTYWKNLKKAIEDYDVKYLLLKEVENEYSHESPFAQLITDYNLTLVLAENKNHLSNEKPPEFDSCMAAANGRLMRCYETQKTPGKFLTSGKDDPDLLYYHMINSARDRNTEFLLIHQITDAAPTPEENAKITQASILKFCVWMHKLGYTYGPAVSLADYTPNLRLMNAGGAYLGILMLIYILYVLRGKSEAHLEWILFIAAIVAFAITWAFPMQLVLLYPTLFAPLGACFSFTLTYAYMQKYKDRLNNFAYTSTALLVGFVSLLACSAVLSAMLSGMEYYLNIYIFRGVSITLLLPIVFALVLMYCREEKKKYSIAELKAMLKNARSQMKPWHIVAGVCIVLVLVVYLLRSGNTKISGLENKIRNVMAEITYARPRTKEFLIGWPAVALFAYYIKNNHSKLLTWAFAAASGILFASVMNTFCHVFTDVTTSALRTVNGLVFAIPLILIFWAVNRIFLNLISKRKLDRQQDL